MSKNFDDVSYFKSQQGTYYKVEVDYDEFADDPYTYDEGLLGHLYGYHRRYSIGENKGNGDPVNDLFTLLDNLDTKKANQIEDDEVTVGRLFKEVKSCPNCVILPVFMLDHSGVSLSTSDYGDEWDSGQVGFIYTTTEDAKKLGVDWDVEKIKEALTREVRAYGLWMNGNVYALTITELVNTDDGAEWDEDNNEYYGNIFADYASEAIKTFSEEYPNFTEVSESEVESYIEQQEKKAELSSNQFVATVLKDNTLPQATGATVEEAVGKLFNMRGKVLKEVDKKIATVKVGYGEYAKYYAVTDPYREEAAAKGRSVLKKYAKLFGDVDPFAWGYEKIRGKSMKNTIYLFDVSTQVKYQAKGRALQEMGVKLSSRNYGIEIGKGRAKACFYIRYDFDQRCYTAELVTRPILNKYFGFSGANIVIVE